MINTIVYVVLFQLIIISSRKEEIVNLEDFIKLKNRTN